MTKNGGRIKLAVLFNIIAPAKIPIYSGLARHFAIEESSTHGQVGAVRAAQVRK
jgi:hypothetical protein